MSTAAGVAMIGLAGRDAFDALFHPEGDATVARVIARGVWRLFRRTGPRHQLFPLGGPVALVAVIGVWAVLLIVGWALVFWPHMPSGFRFDPRVDAAGSDFVHSLNISLVTLTTLGFGDITPTAAALRLILPLEALLGFGLLTSSISWLLLIYPVLSRRRSLAYEIWLLRTAEEETDLAVDRLEPEAEQVYAELTSRLVAVERDLVNFPISYYFAEGASRCPPLRPTCSSSAGAAGRRTGPTASACAPTCSSRRSTTWAGRRPASTAAAATTPRSCCARTRATTYASRSPQSARRVRSHRRHAELTRPHLPARRRPGRVRALLPRDRLRGARAAELRVGVQRLSRSAR